MIGIKEHIDGMAKGYYISYMISGAHNKDPWVSMVVVFPDYLRKGKNLPNVSVKLREHPYNEEVRYLTEEKVVSGVLVAIETLISSFSVKKKPSSQQIKEQARRIYKDINDYCVNENYLVCDEEYIILRHYKK